MEPGRCHVVGVAGVGMSGLAQLLVAHGWTVSGSDRYLDQGTNLPIFTKLRAAGIELLPQDGGGICGPECMVVVSTAIERDNPDIVAAIGKRAPIRHRAAVLAEMLDADKTVAVTGTSGKTTVTGMIGWVLEQAGLDPTVVNGGMLVDWISDRAIGNVRIGHSGWCVVEADESDGSLLEFNPAWAVVTNIGRDHFDINETSRLFTEFSRNVRHDVIGPVPPSTRSDVEQTEMGSRFRYSGATFELIVPGMHNVENAVMAIALCDAIGLDHETIARALLSFRGIARRLELVAEGRGIVVIDDFAHNPAKISAAWNAVAPRSKRVIAIWRPHGFKPLAFMMEELTESIASVCRSSDLFMALPVYYAGGTADKTISSEQLVARLTEKSVVAASVGEKECLQTIKRTARPGDAVLVMGARDPDLPAFARRLAVELELPRASAGAWDVQ
ncbi:MAG: hypothetical protein E4H02_00665 [Lentisphaerales bacterium]|nr:MAG: hypothetical protein E4H02_00665 [Lentisphaerales bacterium]